MAAAGVSVDTAMVLSITAVAVSLLTLTWTIGWSIFTHRRTTLARVAVKSAFSIPVYGTQYNQLGQAALDISATNVGAVTVTLTGAQIRVKRRRIPTHPTPKKRVLSPRSRRGIRARAVRG